jgi:hypothetical protein
MLPFIVNLIRKFLRKGPLRDSASRASIDSTDSDELTILEDGDDDDVIAPFLKGERLEETTLKPPSKPAIKCFRTDTLSYFQPHVRALYANPDTPPLRFISDVATSPKFRIYDHPTWPNWPAVWNIPPFILDPKFLPIPSPETEFQGVLFRLSFKPSHGMLGAPVIHQGTTLVFKGHDNPDVCHFVEWCQLIEDQHAYLKVSGVTKSGHFFPYNDPKHPSFILVVPAELSTVPYPPPLHKFLHPSSKSTKRAPRLSHHI